MTNFERCIRVILQNEGGYVNNINDTGGETKFGISKRTFPNEDIKNLTIERASEIYHEYYWNACNLDLITDINVALHIFDHAVNTGVTTSVKLAQKIVNAKMDGHLGPITAKLINEYLNFIDVFFLARKEYYNTIAKNGNNVVFLRGWLNRVNNTHF